MDDTENMFEFAGIGEVAETTTHLLALSLQSAARSRAGRSALVQDPVQMMVLQQARDHLNKVREGFMLSVRTNEVRNAPEISYLLDRVLVDWEAFSQELGLDSPEPGAPVAGDGEPGEQSGVEKIRFQLLAFAMAAVALGFLPKLPAKEITFPRSFGNPPTYSDIPVPGSAGEMLSRIEEMQGTLWQMMSNNMSELLQHRYGPVRRTYGFFEASAWLTKKDAERFGIKRARSAFSLF